MKTPILIGLCAAMVLGTAEISAGQQEKSPMPLADNNRPESIACAQEHGEPLGECTYSIKQDNNGKTTITVVFPNGFKRGLFFKEGKFLKASVTMSGVGTDTDWSLRDGMHMIRVDNQRYDVPDALIAGD